MPWFYRYRDGWRLIYRWSIDLCFVEIRRWTPREETHRLLQERREDETDRIKKKKGAA